MAAADTVWTGAVSGDYSVAGNWTVAVPVADDVAEFSFGAVSVTAGLAAGGTDLQKIRTSRGYTGALGSAAGALVVSVSNRTTLSSGDPGPSIVYDSPGGAWIGAGASGIDMIEILSTGSNPFNLVSGTTSEVRVSAGTVIIGASATIGAVAGSQYGPALHCIGRGSVTTVFSNATALATVTVGPGATLKTYRNITSAINNGGTIQTLGTAAIAAYTNNSEQSVLLHNSSGTITLATRYAGTITPRGNVNPEVEITTLLDHVNAPGEVVRISGGARFIITSDIMVGRETILKDPSFGA